jgi:tetratricopeptide (TPR) repeat protein
MWTETDEDVLRLLESVELLQAPASEKAGRFEELAEQYAPGTEHRSACLMAAGENWSAAGDTTAARRLFEVAREESTGPDRWDATACLLDVALDERREDEVSALARELLSISRELDLGSAYGRVAESYELHDRLKEAARWYSLANRDIDPDDLDRLDTFALHRRRDVRQRLGLPPDRYDEASAWLTQQQADSPT